jgi:hypothetical protein
LTISVVVVARSGEEALAQCLASLMGVEIIVVDQCGVHPSDVQLIRVDPKLSLSAARAAGFAVASGEILASVVDRYFLRADWSGEVGRMETDVVGGPVEPFPGLSISGWAMFLSEYRSQPSGVHRLPGGNVAYRRAILSAAEMAKTRCELDYHEQLLNKGAQFAFNPNMVAYFAYPPSVLKYAAERFALSRTIGQQKARGVGLGMRAGLAISRLALPPVLIYRIAIQGRQYPFRYALALPWIVAYSVVQMVGEMAGLLARETL